jgi:hypothetical protein
MADETFTTSSVLSHQQARRLAKRKLMIAPPSFTPASWPNALGNEPIDAIGKTVRITQDGAERDFTVEAVGDDGSLWLEHPRG